MPWNPKQYEQFRRERLAPFLDLVKWIQVRDGMTVVDLGCGTGEITEQLAEALPGSQVLGVDNSAEMLAQAQERTRRGLSFQNQSIEKLEGNWDLIFSNAALHWVPGHRKLLPKIIDHLNPKGQLVVQVPANFKHPAHVLIRTVAGKEPFRSALQGWIFKAPVLKAEEYEEVLIAGGLRQVKVTEKTYPHVLADADAIVEWLKGSALIPYLERLPRELQEEFIKKYREEIRQEFPGKTVFFGYRRILFCGRRV